MQSSITKNMKAIRVHKFGPPEVLQYDSNVPIPKPDSGTILLRVRATGVNPVDTYIRAGAFPSKPSLPYIPGMDCAGIVEEVASDVSKFKKGDRIFSGQALSGSYAEYALVSARTAQTLPSELSFEQGAAIPVPYYTAYRALFIHGNAKPGETVLVHGASGGVGVAAVQIARACGMKVLGTAGSQKGLEVASNAGAHCVFDHNSEGYLDAVKEELADCQGVDVIVENAAHINLGNDLSLLAKGGRVLVVGSRGPVEVDPREVMFREAIVTGVMLFNATDAEVQETNAAIRGGLDVGWLRPIVGKKFSLENASRAHEDIMSSKALGKMVLTVPE